MFVLLGTWNVITFKWTKPLISSLFTDSVFRPVLNDAPITVFGYVILEGQQLAQISGTQVALHHHRLAAAVVVVKGQLRLLKNQPAINYRVY
jgi:hypothetical protein